MSFRRYERCKDPGIEWLGAVPSHWDVGRLKHVVAEIASGTSVNAVDTPAVDGEYGVLKTSCVYRGGFNARENKAVAPSEYDRASCPLTANTLIVSRMNTPDLVGAAGLVKEARHGLFLPDRLWQISFVDTEPAFVHYWTLSPGYRAQVQMACSGTSSSMQNLSQDQFRAFVIPLPPAGEQSAIVAFLNRETGKIDALIDEQKRLIELLKEKRQAIISHAVTKGLDPNVPMKYSGVEWLGEVPEHWRVEPLKHLVAIRSGGTPNKENPSFWGGEIPWASAKDLKLDRLSDTADHITEVAISSGAAAIVAELSVLVLVRGMMLARTFPVVLTTVPMAINQDLKALTARHDVQNEFLAWLLRGSADESLSRIDEAGHGTKALRMDAWVSMRLPVPPPGEQGIIAAFLDHATTNFDTLVEEAEAAINLLQERRSALISAAVTGKIDVREAVSPEKGRHHKHQPVLSSPSRHPPNAMAVDPVAELA